MPELPEVQTTIDGIKPYILNKKIIACTVSVKKLRWELQKDLAKKVINVKILTIIRRACSTIHRL